MIKKLEEFTCTRHVAVQVRVAVQEVTNASINNVSPTGIEYKMRDNDWRSVPTDKPIKWYANQEYRRELPPLVRPCDDAAYLFDGGEEVAVTYNEGEAVLELTHFDSDATNIPIAVVLDLLDRGLTDEDLSEVISVMVAARSRR